MPRAPSETAAADLSNLRRLRRHQGGSHAPSVALERRRLSRRDAGGFLEAARAPRGPLLAAACCLCRETLRIRAEPRLLRTDARANPSQDGDAKLPISADLGRFVKRVSRGR